MKFLIISLSIISSFFTLNAQNKEETLPFFQAEKCGDLSQDELNDCLIKILLRFYEIFLILK